MEFSELLELKPYSLNRTDKKKLLTKRLRELTEKHVANCQAYADMLDSISFDVTKTDSYEEIPFLPVRLFKETDLKSVPDDEIVKTMTSSGTTGQSVSKIYLDKKTSTNQQKALVKIVSDFIGSSRMPMIIIDSPSVLKDRRMFSARGAGILGFSIFGSQKMYALDEDMKLNVNALKDFLNMHQGEKILLFGFTFMVWQHFYGELERLKKEGVTFDFSNGILIHGGGWKKLASEAVTPAEFHDRIKAVCGLDCIHDYYGMVEQTGCIYMQCECGHLHASIFSDVIVRRPADFSICDNGEEGILQVLSSIPESYPGHSLLTEDTGVILGEDDCPCGRKGKYFRINGRIAKAEIRGCSDTYAADQLMKNVPAKGEEVWNKVTFFVGDAKSLNDIGKLAVLKPFDPAVMSLLSDISKELMSDTGARSYPDLITLGFWLRKASLEKLRQRFATSELMVGRGVSFHIAPSNVAVNYAYSLFTGLLCGNACIVRIPSKEFPQIAVINAVINRVLSRQEHQALKPYIYLVRYERDQEVNDFFSSICDARIIWGGDATIEEIRKSPIGVRAVEITFADRYSLAVIDADEYLECEDRKRVAEDFYNDTYLSDQNACTSPRCIAWLGEKKQEAKNLFWEELARLVRETYTFQTIQGVDKLSQMFLAASIIPGIKREEMPDNVLYRIKVPVPTPKLMDYRGNSGYFYEYDCNGILELRDFCNDTHCQTIACLCDKEQLEPLLRSGIKGIDRVVRLGRTMDFDLIWDGYNLVEQLTRTIGG